MTKSQIVLVLRAKQALLLHESNRFKLISIFINMLSQHSASYESRFMSKTVGADLCLWQLHNYSIKEKVSTINYELLPVFSFK